MKRAVILAGGLGTRLRPYTTLIPKPLVPLGGRVSIMEVVMHQLRNAGFEHITLTVNHLSHLIMSYFGDGERLGVKIDYSTEEKALSTIGPLTLIDDLPENFLVMNGDVLTELDIASFYDFHLEKGSAISVCTNRRKSKIDFGVLEHEDGLLTAFREKPTYTFDVAMGIYMLNRSVIEGLKRNEVYGLDNLLLDSLAHRRPVNIMPFDGFWLDIGRPDDYEYADQNFDELLGKIGVSL